MIFRAKIEEIREIDMHHRLVFLGEQSGTISDSFELPNRSEWIQCNKDSPDKMLQWEKPR